MIVVNGLALVSRGFAVEKDGTVHASFWVEYACTIYFILELAIKVRTSGLRGYLADGWNRFVAVVVWPAARRRCDRPSR